MRRFAVLLLCGAMLLGGAAQARPVRRQPGKMLHLGTIVVPRKPRACDAKCEAAKSVAIWSAKKAFALFLAM